MPILDSSAFAANNELPDYFRCDVCIIGAGPAGITIARELSGGSLRVTVLESGGTQRQEATDALNEIESFGWPRVADQWLVRNRVLGGSSSTWTGRCAPFDEIDLQYRDWVPYSGWPFDLNELIPYLDRSANYLGLGFGSGFTDDRVWALSGHRQPKVRPDPEKLLPMFWQYSRDPITGDRVRFARRLETELGPNITVITNATALRINATKSGTALESVEFAAEGRRWLLPARTVVLCGGGIENARLLLCSDNVMPNGLGNSKDIVGRFLMDHPRTPVATFSAAQAKAVLSQFHMFRSRTAGANLYHHGMRLSPAIQRSEQLLNTSIWVREHRLWPHQRKGPGGSQDGLTRFPREAREDGSIRRDFREVLADVGLRAYDFKKNIISRRGPAKKLQGLTLDAMCEQRPDRDSRLTLSDRRDHLGMRISRVDWRVSEEEARSLRRITELTVEYLHRVGIGSPVIAEWVRDGAMFPETVRDAAHPTGTTRMADNPARGVVDANCQVHGIDGLFIGGSSVFPTSGHANSTQMIVALALRLADTLKDRAAAAASRDLSRL
jgi:choline dehydrogenase-like flavoprotein